MSNEQDSTQVKEKTIELNLSADSKQTLFFVIRKNGSTPEEIIDTGSLLKKLKKGADTLEKEILDNIGETNKISIPHNFVAGKIDVTVDEFSIAKKSFNSIKSWNPDTEIHIFMELKEQLK